MFYVLHNNTKALPYGTVMYRMLRYRTVRYRTFKATVPYYPEPYGTPYRPVHLLKIASTAGCETVKSDPLKRKYRTFPLMRKDYGGFRCKTRKQPLIQWQFLTIAQYRPHLARGMQGDR